MAKARAEDGDIFALRDCFDLCKIKETEHSGEILDGTMQKFYNETDFDIAHGWSKEVRKIALRFIRERGDSEAEKIYKESLLFDARYDFDCYCRYLEIDREPEKKFYEPRRSVLLPVVHDLQDLYEGRIEFLGVSLPPRTGKSTLCIMFMTFLMGNRPDTANLMSGHSDKLTEPFFREVLSILTDDVTYKWREIFPEVEIAGTSTRNESIDLGRAKRFSTFTARPVGGTLTGAVEIGTGGCLYVDDLIEDLEESLNPERLQKKWDAYLNQLMDRKKSGAFELMVGTRWNVLDPLGRKAQQFANNPRYRFRVIPALDSNGKSNFDYPYKLGFTTEDFKRIKASIDDATWQAKYMGAPYVREGLIFPKKDLRYYYELPEGDADAIWAVCDPAQGGGDYTFLPVFYQYGNDHYLVDCVCSNALPEITDYLSAEVLNRHKVRQVQYERNAAGGRTAAKVQEIVKEQGGVTKFTTKATTSNKSAKILSNSSWIKDHILFLDDAKIIKNSPYAKMMDLLTMYTITGKNKHDDVPDGLSQYAEFVLGMQDGKVRILQRPF